MEAKKILGLDLGVTSIGWAVVSESGTDRQILGMGSRIIPLSTDDKNEFSQGNKITRNQKRTLKRTQRKGYDRYQLRRRTLVGELNKYKMFDEGLFKLKPLELWGLRAKAVQEPITRKELGRVFYHLNQKRGYRSGRAEANMDRKDTEYVAQVKNRHQEIKNQGLTIGQKFFAELQKDQHYRVKQQVFPREAYIEEFDAICREQQRHYPHILTDEFIERLRNEIIFYQRNLKSQKGLVNVCEFEGFSTKTKEGKEVFVGPRVAPRSSPLFQVCKIWETINNLRLKNKRGEELIIPLEKKKELFDYLDNNERLSQAKLFEILGLSKDDGWYGDKHIAKGLQGNLTKAELLKHLDRKSPALTFNLSIEEKPEKISFVDRKTGEILETRCKMVVAPDIEHQPLYLLWHTIYSIPDQQQCATALLNRFRFDDDRAKAGAIAQSLAKIDFSQSAFGNKSVRAMRKILPYLMDGREYSEACSFAGYNHSTSLTKGENLRRHLLNEIPLLSKNSLRQPVVEKILNQMINTVNAIIARYGRPDEIRVELARELKQSREERNEAFASLSRIKRENETIRKRLKEEYGIRATRINVIKWRLFHEVNGDESKVNATCIYCGEQFGLTDALRGANVDVEHIIPKSLLFDDSQSNKTLSHRRCNEAKGNRTAFDFMASKGEGELRRYTERVEQLHKSKIIGKRKRDKLLTIESMIPKDFIERQLRETQYIARKSKEILEQVCRNVWSTSGSVTEHLRRIWGWDDVLMNLQLPKYHELGLTEVVEWESDGQKHQKEVIKDWNKRDDHRHHAIDALTIACTKQGFIQRMNSLSSQHNRDEMFAEIEHQKKEFREKLSLLDSYLILRRPFTTEQVEQKAAEILVSFKAGKKVATFGKRKVKKGGKKEVVQTGIIVPRGPLSEERVYGKIKTIDQKKPAKYLFEHPDLILKPYIRSLVHQRLAKCDDDPKKAFASLKAEPIYLDNEQRVLLQYGSCYKEEYVVKYPIESIGAKDVEYIVDKKVRELVESRLAEYHNKEKEAFKTPLYLNQEKGIAIKTVRMFTGLTAVEPVKRNEQGQPIGFVKPGNNHHIAFYIDENGKKVEHGCTFWHAVERKKYGIPVIIRNPKEVWDCILANSGRYPESFLEKLPNDKWAFDISLEQNEMFFLGMERTELEDALRANDKKSLSQYLYITWSLSESDYWFRHHLETRNTEIKKLTGAKEARRFYRCKSIGAFEELKPLKVRVDRLGEIIR